MNDPTINGTETLPGPHVINLPAPRSLTGQRIQLRRLLARTPEQQAALNQLLADLQREAAADNHQALAPTHVMIRGDEILGYVSIAGMPMINFWAHSGKLHAGESLKMIETAEAVAQHEGCQLVCVPCAENSPFAQHMERLGFQKLGATVLYLKQL
jgi:hypothetical protein